MAGSHSSCEQDVTNGHIWGTYLDYIPNVNRMFPLGKCWAKCPNAYNVPNMFPLKSRSPHPQCQEMFLDIVIGVRKSKKNEGSKLPVIILEVVESTMGTQLLESIKLLFECSAINKLCVRATLHPGASRGDCPIQGC
jgi:hypothetical protein